MNKIPDDYNPDRKLIEGIPLYYEQPGCVCPHCGGLGHMSHCESLQEQGDGSVKFRCPACAGSIHMNQYFYCFADKDESGVCVP